MNTTTISQSTYEHSAISTRPDGERLEMVFTHLPGAEPVFQAATFPIENNPNCEPSAIGLALSLPELQIQYSLLHRLKEDGYLD